MSIYPDKKEGALTGLWVVEVTHGGRRLRKRCPTMDVAKEAEAAMIAKLKRAETTDGIRRAEHKGTAKTLTECARAWGRSLWEGAHQTDCLRKVDIVCSLMGTDPVVSEIDKAWLVEVVQELEDKREASGGTVNRYLSVLSAILKEAVDRDMMPKSPKLPWASESAGRLRWVSREEEAKMLTILNTWGEHKIALFVEIALATGMRRGELLRMRGEHIDGPWVRIWETKNGEPRSVPLSADLRMRFATIGATWGDEKAFLYRLRVVWAKLKKELGLDDDDQFCVHALRHTCATRLVEINTNLTVIQKFMGHKSIQTTLRYAHVNDALLLTAGGGLEAASK